MIISFIHFSDITRDNSSFLSRDLDILFPFFLPISLKVTDAKVIAESCTGFARILGYVIPIQPPNSRMYKRRLTGINGFSCRSNNSWNTLYQLIYFITKIAPLFWYTTRMVRFPNASRILKTTTGDLWFSHSFDTAKSSWAAYVSLKTWSTIAFVDGCQACSHPWTEEVCS